MVRIMYEDMKMKFTDKLWLMAALPILVIIIFCFHTGFVQAAEASISVKEINYSDSTITLQLNSGDTEVYFSDSKKKTWQTVPGDISSSDTITMDISWIPVTKNYVITFKANKSTGIISVTIPKQITNFKVTFNKVKGYVTFGNVGAHTIEWRKKDSSSWNTVNTSTISTELSYLYNNGATVYFRLASVNGTGITDVGFRASKEVALSIPKKAAAPDITVNGSRFSIAVKKGMAYRTVNSDGTNFAWTTISSNNDLLLKNIAAEVMYTNASTTQKTVTLQFRTNATSSAMVSKIATIAIPIQEGPPSADTYGISLSYTSSSSISLQVKAATSTVPFEYTIIKADEELNYLTAGWTAITSSAAVSLGVKNAPAGCHIYIRKKSIEETEDVDFALASAELEITDKTGLVYPEEPKPATLTTLITTAGVCKTTDSSSYLTFSLNSSTATTVSSIELLNTYGISKGTVTCKSSVVKNSNSTGAEDKYIITTKIISTESIDTFTEELLYAKITLANTDVITSTDTAGIRLYLYPSTTVNNPSKEEDYQGEYTDSFNRVYLSKDENDDTYFKFRLDLGTAYVPDSSKVNSFTSQAVAISSLKYDGYTLIKDTDYLVEYGTYKNDDEETIATATVMVNVSKFEGASYIDVTDIAEPLYITLNNGEILKDDISITLVNTATLNKTPMAWSITEGSLKEKNTSTITNSDKSTTTVTEEVITYTLTLTLFDKKYGVGISDVTWGGISILGSTTISDGTATIYLSNAKINKLTTDSTDTKNIIITLSNGFVIKSGCKLTILNAS